MGGPESFGEYIPPEEDFSIPSPESVEQEPSQVEQLIGMLGIDDITAEAIDRKQQELLTRRHELEVTAKGEGTEAAVAQLEIKQIDEQLAQIDQLLIGQ